ncbi:MAG: hypothetical protein IPJ34_17795 [Myxococcales bacterium]|nr:hypothetical protein [Myxococcales bacterium]
MLRFSRSTGLVALFALSALGCGASREVSTGELEDGGTDTGGTSDEGIDLGPTDGGPTLESLDLDPINATIIIDTTSTPVVRAVQTYKVTQKSADGTTKDVTADATMTVDDPSLGTFAGTTFTSTDALPGGVKGVTTVVRASALGKSGAANLTIVQLRRAPDKPGTGDFFFLVPYKGAPSPDKDVLKFGTNIKQVDVAFAMDTTGSMGGQVAGLKASLSSTIFPGLTKAIPSVGLSVAYLDDYPTGSYGSPTCGKALPGDLPVGILQVITTDLKKAQDGANKLETHCGADGPESQIPAMQHILTGEALPWPGGSVAKHTPAAGTTGGVDFRPGALPVIALITDVSWHDAASSPYSFAAPNMTTLKAAFAKANARFVDLTTTFAPETQADELSDATKSALPPAAFGACAAGGTGTCCTDSGGKGRAATGPGGTCRLNFRYTCSGGTCDISTGIVNAIKAISAGSVFDVTATWANDPANPPAEAGGPPVDASKFIKNLRAMKEGDAKAGCPAATTKDTDGDGIDDTFVGVIVGSPVCFEVIPAMNITVPPKSMAQFFNAFINVLGMPGGIKLDLRSVLFEVPPTAEVPK